MTGLPAVCAPEVLRAFLVPLCGGLIFGYAIGFIGPYYTLDRENTECLSFKTKKACTSVKFTSCVWKENLNKCDFNYDCSVFNATDSCKANKNECFWDYDKNICKHFTGIKPALLGLFAAAMTIGGMIGAFTTGPLTKRFGRKKMFFLAGIENLIGGILTHVARIENVYPLHVVARLITGFACGICTVCVPMYTEEMAPKKFQGPVGASFVVFNCFSIMLCALIGLIVEPRNFSVKQTFELRIHLLILFQDFFGIAMCLMSVYTKESNVYLAMLKNLKGDSEPVEIGSLPNDEEVETDDWKEELNEKTDTKVYKTSQMVKQLLIGIVLSVGLQLTGTNAIFSFAPQITARLGMPDMLGNFIVMLWSFISTLGSLVLAKMISMRLMFILFMGIATVSLFIVAIPTFPGVASENVKNGVGMFGLLVFIASFGLGYGTSFYVLCQQIFPSTFRPRGSGVINAVQFLFNVLINLCYPMLVRALSGGASGNQDKGMAIVFLIFASLGTFTFLVCFKWLEEWYKVKH